MPDISKTSLSDVAPSSLLYTDVVNEGTIESNTRRDFLTKKHSNLELFLEESSFNAMVLIEVLQLPWTLIELSDSEVMWRSKSRAVGLAVKLGWKSQVLTFDKIVEQALKDEDASLRSYAILVIPLLVLQSSSARLQTFCEVILYVKFVKAASTYAIDPSSSFCCQICGFHLVSA
jgi:hypothetical protein